MNARTPSPPLDDSPARPAPVRRPKIRFRGRSFLAMVLAPELPLRGWLAELDAMAASSPGFFGGKPVLLDLAALPGAHRDEVADLIRDLSKRGIRIMAIEGGREDQVGPAMPPRIGGGREARAIEGPEKPAAHAVEPGVAEIQTAEPSEKASSAPPETAPQTGPLTEPAPAKPSLVLDQPVRSGQSVVFPDGDVTVIGSVASGAEVIAGGSIHIYGALRGRAIAGTVGQSGARIFCHRFEAELLAIDGLYFTADQMDASLRGKPVQTWLDGDAMLMAALD